jgi:hypothetical protein
VDAQEKSLTADAATRRGLRLESHHYHDDQDDDDGMEYMAETHRVLGLESHHYCDARDDNDWMGHMAFHDWDQLEGGAKEKEKLSVGAAVNRNGLESQHEMKMVFRKGLQLGENAYEKEKRSEIGEGDWDNDWDDDLGVGLNIGLDIGLDIDLDIDLVVELSNSLEESGPLQMDQHLQGDIEVLMEI